MINEINKENIEVHQDINVVYDEDAIFSSLSTLKKKNKDRLIFGNLNINSINNKFDQLKLLVERNIDALVMTESKLNETFFKKQFSMDGYSKPFRKDRNKNGSSVMIISRDDIPSKEIKVDFVPPYIECLSIELNLRKTKWLLIGCYHPPLQKSISFII